MEDIPADFTFKDTMKYGGPSQEQFVGWACGGSHIVAPTSEYMVPPTFDIDTIIYAGLQAKYIKVVKSVFDSLGHYARWDLVNLTTPPQPYEPETNAPAALPTDVRDRVIETVAKEFKLEPEKVAEVIRNAA